MPMRFRFDLRVKGVEKEFVEGMGPGVISSQEVAFQCDPEHPMAAASLLSAKDAFMREEVEVIATPIP